MNLHQDRPVHCAYERVGSFAELRSRVDALAAGLNHIWRWDWRKAASPCAPHDELAVYMVLPRTERLHSITCLVTLADEAAVLEWLSGPRVLGQLVDLWSPLLDEVRTS